jgi:hypothetical protein
VCVKLYGCTSTARTPAGLALHLDLTTQISQA